MSPIARLNGTVAEKGRDHVIVDVGGVGYLVSVPGSTLAKIGAVDSQVALRTYLLVREDALQLFGFLTSDEQEAFEQLLAVTGIGPRSALAFLTQFSPGELSAVVERRDVAALTRVKGVGRRTAERLLLELQGRLKATPSAAEALPARGVAGDEAAAALVALGYSPAEVATAVASVPPPGAVPIEQRIMLALRALDVQ